MVSPNGKGRLQWAMAFTLLSSLLFGVVSTTIPPERRITIGPDGGYEGVTVAISENLEIHDRAAFLDQLKALLKRTSELLFIATEGRVYFAEITILTPRSWPEVSGTLYVGRLEEASIRIDVPNPLYGYLPFTPATTPCGQGEDYIHLTSEAVTGRIPTNESVDVARALVQAWASYRWGIFEEYGYPGHPVYPYFRETSAANWDPTGCSPGYHGVLRTKPGQNCSIDKNGRPGQDCRFFPDDQGIAESACIMYQYYLKSPPVFCTDETHDRTAPNRQNNLCGHRSSWSVMTQHEDFKAARVERANRRETVFHVAAFSGDSPLNVLVVLDVSRGGAPREEFRFWKYLRAELKNLSDNLPYGSWMGVVTYEGQGKNYKFKKLSSFSPMTTDDRRSEIKLAIDSVKAGKESSREPARALKDVGRLVDNARIGKNVYLVFTQMGKGDFDIMAETKVLMLQEQGIKIMGMSFLDPRTSPGLAELSLKTGGLWTTVQKTTMREDIRDFLQFISSSKSVHNQLFLISSGVLQIGPEYSRKAEIFVENGLGRRSTFTVESADRIEAKLITPSRKVINVVRNTACNLVSGQYYCNFDPAEPGDWEINITCSRSPCSSQTTVGFEAYSYQRLESQVSPSELPTVNVWAGAASSNGIVDLSEEDFLLYARVQIGSAPVLNLNVILTAESCSKSSVVYSTILTDDGLDPDITAGDGVYTGVIFPESPDTFLLSATIEGTGKIPNYPAGDERWHTTEWDKGPAARDSSTDEATESADREYQMQRTLLKFTTVKVVGPAGLKARPQRISDLRILTPVLYDSSAAFITLRWTSPNPRDGTTKVTRYFLYSSFNLDAILNFNGSANWTAIERRDIFPENGLAPLDAGEEHTVISRIQMKNASTAAYFRIRSVNRLGTESEFSRIVPVYLKGAENKSASNPLDISDSEWYTFLTRMNDAIPSRATRTNALPNPAAVSSNTNSGNNTHSTPKSSLTRRPWFIAVISVVGILLLAAIVTGIVLIFRYKHRKRHNSLTEKILGWSCLKGGAARRNEADDRIQKTYGEGVWSCMSRGYTSTGNLAASVATVGRVEANRWMTLGAKEEGHNNNGFVSSDDVVDCDQNVDGDAKEPGPYKEVFIRDPRDVTTEL
ncbi:calcium-activated chloride channel regulator 1-like isoform X2 [Ischnura elegans]|uniref:calcium-activated chloride channel regulator 1-like isoform X2 n=1 Tax=Ischnura elegans TaxID=197161 RepID=UPI001ED8B714|nr:calcium-activated chloride channel regulator 1-like isoform X2 [Ischnura elegans]